MKKNFTKISLFILIALIIASCDITKRVPAGKKLLYKNEIQVDKKVNSDEELTNQLYQKPNSAILGYRLRLNLYNWAKVKNDSIYRLKYKNNPKKYERKVKWLSKKQVNRLGHSFWYEGVHNFLRKTGEAPVIYDSLSASKSARRLRSYFYNQGYFDVKATTSTDSVGAKKINLKYLVDRGTPYKIDTIKSIIATPILDSLYKTKSYASFIKSGNQYLSKDLDDERSRITQQFRNNGVFFFQQNYITYALDTINTGKKVNIDLVIKDQNIRVNDTNKTQPFKIYKINKVNVFTDQSPNKKSFKVKDSITYNGFNLYSENKLKYKPKAITDAIFITPGSVYSDENSLLTSKYLSNLKVFNYPLIQYTTDVNDEDGLIANIVLTPRKKYTFNFSTDFTHSDIQEFGIVGNTSLSIRNVFNGAETFEIGLRGNIGSSKDQANPNDNFFNLSEIGADAKLNFPRILAPFNTSKIIPKNMIPSTTLSVGFSKQTNIGLDKQNFTSSFTYNWSPKKNSTMKFDLLNIQFVKNVNQSNYFNIYRSSYETLNQLAIQYNADLAYFNDNVYSNGLLVENGVFAFTDDFLNNQNISPFPSDNDIKTVTSILERRKRLIENNLIFSSSFSFSKTTKSSLTDNNFYSLKTKVESAGNLLSVLARLSKQLEQQEGANTFFDVEFSQYLKTEFEFIKHWDLGKRNVLATRTFAGIAIPYGNSKNIPFSRSYFAGGTNDIRAWQPYSLGPGKSGGILDFNEANMKISINTEFRFNIFKSLNGALFADAGNIWNVFDNVTDDNYKFQGFKSLETFALGTGFGLRYDFGLFVVRGDLGFKTYNPSVELENKWFREINLSKSVINIGINYPF